MEAAAAGPSVQAATSQPLLKSPKKSPKKHPRFSSPKKSPNKHKPTPINANKNDHIKILTRSSDASTSRYQAPFSRRLPNEALISAIEKKDGKLQNKPEENATQRAVPAVDLKITVQNSVPVMRSVQSVPLTTSMDSKLSAPINPLPKPVIWFPTTPAPFQSGRGTENSQNSSQTNPSQNTPHHNNNSQNNPPQNIQNNPSQNVHNNLSQNNAPYNNSSKRGRNKGRNQYRPNWRDHRAGWNKLDDDDCEYYRKVVVTSFPAYTKSDELVKKLAVFGPAQIEHMKNRVAVVAFDSGREAVEAIRANNTIAVYGTVLTIMKYSTKKHVVDLIKANRMVVKNEHKGPPITAPTEIDLSGDFEQQMQNIEDAIRLTQEEVDNINLLFEDVEKYMRMIFPTCEAVPFGSITTGLGIKSSDADCFLSLSPGSGGRPGAGAAELCSQFVARAARLLRLHPQVFSKLVAIPRANTPIIKFLHVPTNVNCDLNSKTPLGVQNSRLLGHLLGAHPSLGSVALLLKYWARVQQLSGTGRITNYALLLLLVFYLQQTLLPPVYKLQDAEHSFIVEHWEAGFSRAPLSLSGPVPSPRELLGGFFTFYASFDFDELVVCPLLGRPLKKMAFEANILPPELSLYQRNVALELALGVRTSCDLCVQDPFELSHNVTSAVSHSLAQLLRAHIQLAAEASALAPAPAGHLLRTALLAAPRPAAPAALALPARALLRLPPRWPPLLAAELRRLFQDILLIHIARAAAASKEAGVNVELYCGRALRPVWRRAGAGAEGGAGAGAEAGAGAAGAARLSAQAASIAGIVHNKQIADVNLPFLLELQFREKPRGLSIMIWPLDGADMDTFPAFRKFVYSFIHRWHKELLKPYIVIEPLQDPKNSPAKTPRGSTPIQIEPTPIETVAFVNSNHKDLCDSVDAISLNGSKMTLKNDAT